MKKNLVPDSIHTRPGEENSENDSKKIQKLKNLNLALFLAKTRLDRPRKRKKNFSPKFRLYSTWVRKLRKNSKKIQKIQKPLSGIFVSQNRMM